MVGVNQPPALTGANMNMTVTIFGFVLSALFVIMICCRLLCFRLSSTREMAGPARNRVNLVDRALQGLEPSTVASFPTIKYNQHIFVSSEDNICTICLGEFEEKEELRVLPNCGHAFHVVCIDVWLHQHPTCPVCRVSLQVFPNWRRLSGPLLSLTAKSRFVAGAIPDSMFEQQRGFHVLPMSRMHKENNTHDKDSIADIEHCKPTTLDAAFGNTRVFSAQCLHSGRPMVAGCRALVEMAESSISRHQAPVLATDRPIVNLCKDDGLYETLSMKLKYQNH